MMKVVLKKGKYGVKVEELSFENIIEVEIKGEEKDRFKIMYDERIKNVVVYVQEVNSSECENKILEWKEENMGRKNLLLCQ